MARKKVRSKKGRKTGSKTKSKSKGGGGKGSRKGGYRICCNTRWQEIVWRRSFRNKRGGKKSNC